MTPPLDPGDFHVDLAMRLGLLKDGEADYRRCKAFFWSSSALGDVMHYFVCDLIEHGAILEDDDGRLAWNPDFDLAKMK